MSGLSQEVNLDLSKDLCALLLCDLNLRRFRYLCMLCYILHSFPLFIFLPFSNEREGIPANLLQMLDVCVEIPQQGIIRSLNVHVSAALLIWEYTRQHLSSGSAEVDSKRS